MNDLTPIERFSPAVWALAERVWAEMLTVKHPADEFEKLRDIEEIAQALLSRPAGIAEEEAAQQYPSKFLGRCGVCLDNAYLSQTPCKPSRAQGSPLFPEDCPIHRARSAYAIPALPPTKQGEGE